jgi:hypothetical protein
MIFVVHTGMLRRRCDTKIVAMTLPTARTPIRFGAVRNRGAERANGVS